MFSRLLKILVFVALAIASINVSAGGFRSARVDRATHSM